MVVYLLRFGSADKRAKTHSKSLEFIRYTDTGFQRTGSVYSAFDGKRSVGAGQCFKRLLRRPQTEANQFWLISKNWQPRNSTPFFAKVLRQTNALIRDAVYNNDLLITLTEKQHLFVWITAT